MRPACALRPGWVGDGRVDRSAWTRSGLGPSGVFVVVAHHALGATDAAVSGWIRRPGARLAESIAAAERHHGLSWTDLLGLLDVPSALRRPPSDVRSRWCRASDPEGLRKERLLWERRLRRAVEAARPRDVAAREASREGPATLVAPRGPWGAVEQDLQNGGDVSGPAAAAPQRDRPPVASSSLLSSRT